MKAYKEKAHKLIAQLRDLAKESYPKVMYSYRKSEDNPTKPPEFGQSMHNMTLGQIEQLKNSSLDFSMMVSGRRIGKSVMSSMMIEQLFYEYDAKFGVVYYKDRRWLARALIDNFDEVQLRVVNMTHCMEDTLELEKQLFERI